VCVVCVCVDVLAPGLRSFACVRKGKCCRWQNLVRRRAARRPLAGGVAGLLLLVRPESRDSMESGRRQHRVCKGDSIENAKARNPSTMSD
jgi:hypothetical protein